MFAVGGMGAALEMVYDKWENGDPCYEDVETQGGFLGKTFKLSYEEENEILALLPHSAVEEAEKEGKL